MWLQRTYWRPTSICQASKRTSCLYFSTHVGDLKGVGKQEHLDHLLAVFEKELDKLTVQHDAFEHTGVTHESIPSSVSADKISSSDKSKPHGDNLKGSVPGSYEIFTHQQHYVSQIKPIGTAPLAKLNPSDEVPEHVVGLYMFLVGALAWLVITRADIAIHIAALQRKLSKPKKEDVKKANLVLGYARRGPCGIR